MGKLIKFIIPPIAGMLAVRLAHVSAIAVNAAVPNNANIKKIKKLPLIFKLE